MSRDVNWMYDNLNQVKSGAEQKYEHFTIGQLELIQKDMWNRYNNYEHDDNDPEGVNREILYNEVQEVHQFLLERKAILYDKIMDDIDSQTSPAFNAVKSYLKNFR